MRRGCIGLVLITGLACGRAAGQDASSPLGTRGTWVIAGRASASYEKRTWSGVSDSWVGGSTWTLSVAPTALLFVAKNFALGTGLYTELNRHTRSDQLRLHDTGFGGAAALMYRIGLEGTFSLMPELSLGATRVLRVLDASTSPTFLPFAQTLHSHSTQVHVELVVPLITAPTAGFFWGAGPFLRFVYAISGDLQPVAQDWVLSFGFATAAGTWF